MPLPSSTSGPLSVSEGQALTRPWRDRSLPQLIEHLLTRYHRPLRRQLETLQLLADEVERKHGHWNRERLREIQGTAGALAEELLSHMTKEEEVLFPWILSGDGSTAGTPITVMQHEHHGTRRTLSRLASLTEGPSPPGTCRTWCRLRVLVRDLTRDLEEHMLLEDSVLFPRALREPRSDTR